MKLMDRAVRSLALHWLKRRVDKARKEGSVMLRAIDGWKSFIVVMGFIATTIYGLIAGHDVSSLVQSILGALGWADADLIERAKVLATVVAPLLIAIWAAGSRLLKAVRQWRAGASASELLSTQGYVKQALDDGTLRIVHGAPVVRG